MNFERQPNPDSAGYNYNHYPELDDAPAFAWSGQQRTENEPHYFSGDEESVQNRGLSDGENESNVSDYQRSVTR